MIRNRMTKYEASPTGAFIEEELMSDIAYGKVNSLKTIVKVNPKRRWMEFYAESTSNKE